MEMDLRTYIDEVDGSQMELAKRSGVSQTTISDLCLGRPCSFEGAWRLVLASRRRPAPGGRVLTLDGLAAALYQQ